MTIAAVTAAALALLLTAGRANAAVGPAFDPATPTVFVAHGTPTIQLSKAVESNGTLVFENIGGPQPEYNAIAYDTVDNYLYGVDFTTGATRGDIIQVGSDGVPNDLGINIGTTPQVIAAWNPVNDEVYFATGVGGAEALVPFDPATKTLGAAIPVSANLPPDLTYAQGYFWGWGSGLIDRVDPATGQVTTFPGTDSLFPNCFGAPACGGAGADWTYGNGNIGFNENQGEIYQISITNGGSANPTFKLVSQQPGPASANIDGAANPGLPTDLVMHKAASSQVPDGGKVTYTLTVTNNGPGDSSGYTISDTLPAGLSNPTTTSTGCSISGDTLTCVSANPLAHGQTSAPVTVSGSVPNPFVKPITNTATVTANEQDPDPTNNSSSITSTPSADLSVTKSAAPAAAAVPGTNETYTIVAKNNGPDTAIDASVSDSLPSALSFVSASSGCTFASGKVTCQVGNMAPGATKTFQVVTKVSSSDTARIDNTATVTSSTPDPDPTNNKSTASTGVGPKADLSITKTPSAATLTAGGQEMYTLVVANNGPSDATGVSVSDAVPAEETLVSAQPSQGSCSGTTCTLGTIANGGSAQILVTVDVSASASGRITNSATVIGNNPDPDPTNNTDGSTVTVNPPPAPTQPTSDVQVVKHANHHKVAVGQTITYTLVVTNHGPDAAKGVKITDTPSKALKVLSVKPGHGTCTRGKVLRCSLGTIADGKKITIRITARMLKVGTEANAASATSTSKDPKPANNLSKVKAKIVKRRAVLHVRKIASAKTITAGDRITYRIRVSASKAAAHHVKVCDALPLGLSFMGSTPKAKLSKGKECWTINTLGKGKHRTFTVHARALKGTSGRKTNHATATAKGAKTARGKATVRVKPAPKPPATPVTGARPGRH